MATKVFIDGREGTTGLQIDARLGCRDDLTLLTLPEAQRKDTEARRAMLNEADFVFLCLPDAAAREAVSLIENPAVRVIDASTAHRVADGWVYGFAELTKGQRERIASASRVANPGCHATGFLAAVRPLVELGLLAPEAAVVTTSLTGYTGGGKKTIAEYESADRAVELDSPRLYGLTLTHKHIPEMMRYSGLTTKPIFNPVICDFPCGMLVTTSLFASQLGGAKLADVLGAYRTFYAGEAGIEVRSAPDCGFLGSNNLAGTCKLQIFVCGNDEQYTVSTRIDNLGKGASGAAVENLNIMLGLSDDFGL
jgi:N-acetyl-gamma-glutamyl-phosphate reductase